MDKIYYSIYSEQSECTHSYSWKPCKNDTVDVSSSAYHSMSQWANQYVNVRSKEMRTRQTTEVVANIAWNAVETFP